MDEIALQQNGNPATPLVVIDGKDDPTVKEKLARRNSEGGIRTRGRIYVRNCTITHTPSFLDYIKSGSQVNLIIFIYCYYYYYDYILKLLLFLVTINGWY